MQQHTRHVWTHLVVLCSLEQEGGAVVLRGQLLSSKFGNLWIYGAFKTSGCRIYNSEFGWPFKTYFPSRSSFILELTVVLVATQIIRHWQHGQCWMLIISILEKSPLIPDLRPHSHCHWFLPNHPLRFPTFCVMFMSNGKWAPIHNLSSLFLFIWQGLKKICK